MTFEEWYGVNRSAISDMSRKNAAKSIWQAGYQSALDGWVNNKSKKE